MSRRANVGPCSVGNNPPLIGLSSVEAAASEAEADMSNGETENSRKRGYGFRVSKYVLSYSEIITDFAIFTLNITTWRVDIGLWAK